MSVENNYISALATSSNELDNSLWMSSDGVGLFPIPGVIQYDNEINNTSQDDKNIIGDRARRVMINCKLLADYGINNTHSELYEENFIIKSCLQELHYSGVDRISDTRQMEFQLHQIIKAGSDQQPADYSDGDIPDDDPTLQNFCKSVDYYFTTHIHSPFPSRPSTLLFKPGDYKSREDRSCVTNIPVVKNTNREPLLGSYGVSSQSTLKISKKKRSQFYTTHIGEGAVRFGVLLATLQRGGIRLTPDLRGNWNLLWAKRIKADEYECLAPNQKVNHFPGTWGIGRKDALGRNTAAMRKKFGSHFAFHPKTYVLPAEAWHLSNAMEQQRSAGQRPTYILKPSAAACGKGIFWYNIFFYPFHKKKKKKKKKTGIKLIDKPPSINAAKPCVVQEYISNPLLIDGLKFDLRLYVCLTSISPMRLYIYKEGLVRFATEKYPKDDKGGKQSTNKYAHLTNYSINKTNSKYNVEGDGDGDDSSKWSLTTFRNWCSENKIDWNLIKVQIDDIVIKTFLSIEDTIYSQFQQHVRSDNGCFEIFGFDVLLDDNLNAHLLEVNIMPSINTQSALDSEIKANFVADLFTLVGLPSSPSPPKSSEFKKKFENNHHADKLLHLWGAMSDCDRLMIADSEEEYSRRGHFSRIFPIAHHYPYYKNFFESERRTNNLLYRWEIAKANAWENLGLGPSPSPVILERNSHSAAAASRGMSGRVVGTASSSSTNSSITKVNRISKTGNSSRCVYCLTSLSLWIGLIKSTQNRRTPAVFPTPARACSVPIGMRSLSKTPPTTTASLASIRRRAPSVSHRPVKSERSGCRLPLAAPSDFLVNDAPPAYSSVCLKSVILDNHQQSVDLLNLINTKIKQKAAAISYPSNRYGNFVSSVGNIRPGTVPR